MKKLTLLFSVLLSFHASAACVHPSGIWSEAMDHTQADLENAGSYHELLWSFFGPNLVSNENGYDSFGMYFQYQSVYVAQLNEQNCMLSAQGQVAISKSFRNFEDPREDFSEDRAALNDAHFYRFEKVSETEIRMNEYRDAQGTQLISSRVLKRLLSAKAMR